MRFDPDARRLGGAGRFAHAAADASGLNLHDPMMRVQANRLLAQRTAVDADGAILSVAAWAAQTRHVADDRNAHVDFAGVGHEVERIGWADLHAGQLIANHARTESRINVGITASDAVGWMFAGLIHLNALGGAGGQAVAALGAGVVEKRLREGAGRTQITRRLKIWSAMIHAELIRSQGAGELIGHVLTGLFELFHPSDRQSPKKRPTIDR